MTPIPSEHAQGPPGDPGLWSRRAHEVVESVADRVPGNLALVCAHTRLTYEQLDRRANAIAHSLIRSGVRPGDRVALVMPRCQQLFVALLGVLKAGAVYVPLDPSHPEDRNRRIIEAAEPKAVLTAPGTPQLAWLQGLSVTNAGDASAERADRPAVPGDAGDLAYILFTSGSTGEPKGVPIRHDGISRLVLGQDYAPFGPDLPWLKLAPMGFDASTVEIYGAWMWGAPLVVWDRDSIDADGIADLIEREGVRACFLSFGLFSTLLDAAPRFFEHIRVITTGSEPVLPSVIRRASNRFPDMNIVVAYGPTEATAFTTTFPGNNPDHSLPTVPLGKPLNGLHCRLLDEQGQPVPTGEPGEICIGGVGITPGYLNRPDLNAKAFVDDPLVPGERLYRSGDLARELPSGDLIFLGRVDNQVKVRGNRVELGEIESVIESMPGVHRAAAAVAGENDNQHVVVGIIAKGTPPNADAVRAHAEAGLPPYMVPSVVGVLDVFPYTENGKIDRAKLAAYVSQPDEATSTEPSEPPTTGTERTIAAIWQEVLGVPAVSRSDTFLRLGGHSLRAIVVCARIRAATGVRVSVPELMRLGPLSAVASHVDAASTDSAEPLRLAPNQPTEAQQRLWLLDRLEPGDPTYTITFRIDLDAVPDREPFERACRALIERHTALRTGFRASDDRAERYLLPMDEVGDPDIRWPERWSDQDTESFDRAFAREPFDLTAPPLIRFAIRRPKNNSDAGCTVLVAMHHVVSDGWSCGVIRRDLNALYQHEASGTPVDLPELPEDPTGLWCEHHTEADADWWAEYLRDADLVDLYPERAEPAPDPRAGITVSLDLPAGVMDRVRALAARLGVTTYAVVSGAYHAWLHRVSRCQDLVVGTPVACRDFPGVEHAVGFYMATLPTRTPVRSSDTGAVVIERVAASYRQAEARRAVPYQTIIERQHQGHDPDHNPLFDVFFNYISMEFGSGGTGVTPADIEIDNGTAKFDLTCYALETASTLRLKLNARAGIADQASLRRWWGQLARTIESIADSPDSPIGSIPLLSDDEAARFERHRTHPAIETDKPSHAFARIRAMATEDPGGEAIALDGVPVTYRQLVRDAERVAAGLRAAGVTPGTRVLCRCQDHQAMAQAILGTLAADACYVPIDPNWPEARIAEVASIARATHAITDHETQPLPRVQTLGLGQLLPHAGEDAPSPTMSGDADAYVLFTSGSTGTPKGVVQTHAGLCAQMDAFADSVGITPYDRIGMTSSHAFDSAVMDMFGAWFTGAAWCPLSLDTAEAPAAQAARRGVTILHAAPSVLRSMGEQNTPANSVRTVVLGGEPARREDLRIVRRLFPGCTLVANGMGMSESSLTVQWRAHPSLPIPGNRLPIGGATAGVSVALRSPDGQHTDLLGEIEILTDRLAHGVIDPATGETKPIGQPTEGNTRRFATGDLARVRPDGSLEHLGRADAQLKVSGVRIEPGEVRAALCALRDVLDAAVVGDTSDAGHAILCAAVVPAPGQITTPAAIRDQLADHLPRAMLPARIAVLKALPRTGGGKVSIPAVRAACRNAGAAAEHARAAETDTERTIAQTFAETLGLDTVGGDDDFFALGGTSLLALRAFAKLRDRLGTDLPVITMFRAPTPIRLAALISDEDDPHTDRSLVAMGKGSGTPVCFLPGIGGNPHSFTPIAARLEGNHPSHGYQLPGVMGESKPLTSIGAIVEHLLERLPDAAPALVGYSFGGTLAFETALQLQRQGRTPAAVILVDAHYMPGLPRRTFAGRAAAHARSMLAAPGAGRLTYLSKRVSRKRKPRTLGGLYQTDETLASVKELILANRHALEAYRAREHYRGDALLFRAQQPGWMRFHRDDGANGWRSVIKGNVRVVEIDVPHNRVLHESSADELARHIADWLKKH